MIHLPNKTTFITIIFFHVIFLTCHSQNAYEQRIFERIGDVAYLKEHDRVAVIDNKKVIAKIKPGINLNEYDFSHKEINRRIVQIAVPDNLRVEDFVKYLEDSGFFEYVDFNFSINLTELQTNDTYSTDQWYINHLSINDAWDITTGSPNVKVAIIDSGTDPNHYDLNLGNDSYSNFDFYNGYDYINNTSYSIPVNSHGTKVAGIVGAKTNNNLGISGISGGNNCPGVTILPYNVGDSNDATEISHIIFAIEDAVEKGVKVINLSGGGISNFALHDSIINAYNHGVIIICATGNIHSSFIDYPAAYEETIAVGASDQYDIRVDSSNYGAGLDLIAPGKDIKTTDLNVGYCVSVTCINQTNNYFLPRPR